MINQYEEFLSYVYQNGTFKSDRTGTGTKSVFGYQMRFNLNDGFPLISTKKVHLKSIIHELLWFLQGNTNIQYLKENTFGLYPNPAANSVNIELNIFNTITITDINGKLILNKMANNLEILTINTSEWAKGIYIVTASNNKTKAIKKLIIQ